MYRVRDSLVSLGLALSRFWGNGDRANKGRERFSFVIGSTPGCQSKARFSTVCILTKNTSHFCYVLRKTCIPHFCAGDTSPVKICIQKWNLSKLSTQGITPKKVDAFVHSVPNFLPSCLTIESKSRLICVLLYMCLFL